MGLVFMKFGNFGGYKLLRTHVFFAYGHVFFFGCQVFVITKWSKITKMSIYGVQVVRKM